MHLNPAPASSAERDDLRDTAGTPLVGSAGKETTDVAIAGGTDPETGAPLDINLDGIPDIVLAVDGEARAQPHPILLARRQPETGDSYGHATIRDRCEREHRRQAAPPSDPRKDETVGVTLVDVDGDGMTARRCVFFDNADGTTDTYYNEGGDLDAQEIVDPRRL